VPKRGVRRDMAKTTFDSLIVGAGPAGLSAAIYLGRARRSTLVIDAGRGRATGPQMNENYLGFPRGVKASRLRELGQRQAERFGARVVQGTIDVATCNDDREFELTGDCGVWRGHSVVIATGVTDIWPSFPGVERYVGRSLFWCIVCDGFRTVDTRTVLIGADDEAATTACQFLTYTKELTFIATGVGGDLQVSPAQIESMRENGIEVIEGAIERVEGVRGQVRRVHAGGRVLEAELLFSLLGQVPNSRLAASLGVLLDEKGYVRIDREQRTNVPHVYAAGDVTGPYAHQIAAAVHEGATAGQTANFDLYPPFQQGKVE
jgi:thioredoxin reductase (NADPH)